MSNRAEENLRVRARIAVVAYSIALLLTGFLLGVIWRW